MKSSKNIVTLAGYILLSSFVAALPSGYIPVYGQSDADRKGKPAATETPGTSNDVVLSAFADELSRSMSRLQLKDHAPPYFISYLAKSTESFVVSSRFGALDSLLDEHRRTLATDVRVGSYKFDSSRSAQHDPFEFAFGERGFYIPNDCSLEDNYDAIRHDLWLKTDSAYKNAIESLEGKKAQLEQKKVEDLPDSMSHAQVVVSTQPPVHLQVDKQRWQNTVRDISNTFRSYPPVIDASVSFLSGTETRWFANSEGSLNREGEQVVYFDMTATAQAKDGMIVSDDDLVAAAGEEGLPPSEELKARAQNLAKNVALLANSPPVESYRGPVLFEKQAAAEFFAQTLVPNLVNKGDSLTRSGYQPSPVGERIGRRILPTYITVVDDPLARTFQEKKLTGGYLIDDEGVPAQKLTLVDKGILKTLCSGRTPSRYVKESNGHWLDGAAHPSQLFVSSSETFSLDSLRKKLLDKGKEEELEYVLVVRHIESPMVKLKGKEFSEVEMLFHPHYREKINLTTPTLLYKIYLADGHEELVRGAKFEHLTTRIWRDIDGMGDDADVYPVFYPVPGNLATMSLITPSVLVSEVEIERQSHETDSPMILRNAYFENSTDRSSFR